MQRYNSSVQAFTSRVSFLASAALLGAGLVGHAAPVSWQVQSDYFGERNAIGQPRTIRGLALSEDESSIYHGNIQSPNTGSTALRRVKSIVLAIPGTDHVIFGNGMPGGIGAFGQVGGQPVYAGGGTGTFEGWRDVGNSPESIDTDDRGYVYVALSSGISSADAVGIYDAGLSTQVGQLIRTRPTGVAVRKLGGFYYAYVISGNGLQRFDVTTVFPASPDPSWTPPIFGTAATSGRSLAVDADGTVFVAGDNLVRRVSPDGTTITHSVSVPNAADVAIFQDKVYVIKRQSPTQPIVVLNKAGLTSGGPDITTPDLGIGLARPRGSLSEFTSIDISHDGRIYVSEENYTAGDNGIPAYTPPATSFNPIPGPITGRIYFDRILVSSPLPDVEAPVVTCPPNQTVNTDANSCTATVNPGMATAEDGVDGPVATTGTRSDAQSLNAPYPLGTTTITWTAMDSAGNPGSCTQTITVEDHQAPVLTCPTVPSIPNDSGQCGATVTYPLPSVSDNCSTAGVPACTPPPGSFFPVGPTMVFCLANDAAGNPGSCSFTLTVTDAEAPVLSCPAGITVGTDDGVCEAVVSFAATAMDNCTANPSVVCMPAPSSVFAKGTTPVNCTTMDAAGNPASCAFNVTVVDDEAPVLTCPANITTTPTSPSGAVVNYPPATVSDNCDTLTATCMPPSGSTFPIGTTTVTCTAADSAGNNATPCTFTVSVVGSPRVTKQNQIAYLQGLYPTITNSKQKGKVKEAIDNLIKSLNAAYWVDNSHLVEPGGYRVFDYEKTAVTKLRDAINYGLNPALVQPTINALVAADRDLAATAIAQAISANGNAGKIAQAQAQLAKGDTEAANNKPDRAIDAYKNAWKYAVAAF